MKAAQGVVANLAIEPAQRAGGHLGIDEEGAYGRHAAVFLAQSAEGFDACDEAGGGINERLKKCYCLPVYHGRILDLRKGNNSEAWYRV